MNQREMSNEATCQFIDHQYEENNHILNDLISPTKMTFIIIDSATGRRTNVPISALRLKVGKINVLEDANIKEQLNHKARIHVEKQFESFVVQIEKDPYQANVLNSVFISFSKPSVAFVL